MASIEPKSWSSGILRKDAREKEFCYIPEGTFYSGEHAELVTIPAAFFISRYPVTKADFHEFLATTNYEYDDHHREIMDKLSPHPACPATPVSWWDAKTYIRWIRRITKEYYSLPGEWEWEFAAKGKNRWTYPWGDAYPSEFQANFSSDYLQIKTTRVDEKVMGESPFGCRDMVGNVWEWCLDDFDDEGDVRVLKGGCCLDNGGVCSVSARKFCYPANHRMIYAGFRMIYLPGDLYLKYRRVIDSEEYSETGTLGQKRGENFPFNLRI